MDIEQNREPETSGCCGMELEGESPDESPEFRLRVESDCNPAKSGSSSMDLECEPEADETFGFGTSIDSTNADLNINTNSTGTDPSTGTHPMFSRAQILEISKRDLRSGLERDHNMDLERDLNVEQNDLRFDPFRGCEKSYSQNVSGDSRFSGDVKKEYTKSNINTNLEHNTLDPSNADPSNNADPSTNKLKKELRKTLSAKARRILARIKQKENEIIDLKEVFYGTSQEDLPKSIIVDSGTVMHISRSKENFRTVSDKQIRIRGVAGTSKGHVGVLKPSVLGENLKAILFPDLPVECLLSTEGLKRIHWETHFTEKRDYLQNNRTLAEIDLTKNERNLPSFDLKFFESAEELEGGAFLCSPCDERDEEESHFGKGFSTYPVYSNLPDRLKIPNNGAKTQKGKAKRSQKYPKTPRAATKLLQHQRLCHMHDSTLNVRCLDCLENKGKRGGANKVRTEKYEKNPLVLFSGDFFGKVSPQSIRGNSWVLVFICDVCNYAHVEVLEAKSQAPEALIRFTKKIRETCGAQAGDLIFAGIHTDNEPVLKGSRWKEACSLMKIHEMHSIPYVPQTNGTVERFIQTIKDALRTMMSGVDGRCWDWAVEHATTVWNMKDHAKCTKWNNNILCSPDQVVANKSKNPFVHSTKGRFKYLKRFGCLAFFKPYRNPIEAESDRNKVLLPKRLRGIHLGFSRNNSSYLIGTVNMEGRFSTYESRDVSFCEDILVSDVRALNTHKENSVPPLLDILLDRLKPFSSDVSQAVGSAKAQVSSPDVGAVVDQTVGLERTQWEVTEVEKETPLRMEDLGPLKIESPKPDIVLKQNIRGCPAEFNIDSDPDSKVHEPTATPLVSEAKPLEMGPDKNLASAQSKDSPTLGQHSGVLPGGEVQFGPPTDPKRKRGRPKGSKDCKPRKKRGKKLNGKKLDLAEAFGILEDDVAYDDVFSHLVMEEGEVIEAAEIFLAKDCKPSQPGDAVKASWAFSDENPEKPRWIEARDVEQARLVAYETWRKLTPEEEESWRRGDLKATPTALILNRKR